MTLYEKIMKLYPELMSHDFGGALATIELRNDANGQGDYIAKWEHPTLERPTEEQLNAVEE